MGGSLGEPVRSGVGVVDKTAAILDALEQRACSLAELAASTSMPRATAHRLALALERHRLVDRDAAGRFVLGPRLAVLGREAGRGARSLAEAAAPALGDLRDRTGESTQLYVAAGDRRVCVLSLESPHGLRTIVPVGASLPMDRGSAGKVLAPGAGPPRRGWAESVEERERGVASVSAPVVVDGAVVAAVSVSGPIERTSRQPGRRYGTAVVVAARAVERRLAGG
ncbi:MAG: IclR family transcriptional regulator [Acidimicrobiales bacterium]